MVNEEGKKDEELAYEYRTPSLDAGGQVLVAAQRAQRRTERDLAMRFVE